MSIIIPENVTSIPTYMLNGCYSLSELIIPENVTSIGNYAFQNCYSMGEYHIKPTTPPTLGGSGVFTNISSDCKIYVPYSADHSILAAY
ncbi:MAG: leucine-rich repeat domain-containing protein [Bacillota bacterium]|nr:leucine-rich repeat domain-containing protein [Bacillota bacterium]